SGNREVAVRRRKRPRGIRPPNPKRSASRNATASSSSRLASTCSSVLATVLRTQFAHYVVEGNGRSFITIEFGQAAFRLVNPRLLDLALLGSEKAVPQGLGKRAALLDRKLHCIFTDFGQRPCHPQILPRLHRLPKLLSLEVR